MSNLLKRPTRIYMPSRMTTTMPSIRSIERPFTTNRFGNIKNRPGAISKSSVTADLISSYNIGHGYEADKSTEGMLEAFSTFTWVYAAIYTISNNAAGIPLILYEESEDSSEVIEIMDSPILSVLNKPNPYMTRQDLIEGTFVYLESTGNCFWELVYDGLGLVKEIYFLNPKNIKIYPSKKNFISHYGYTVNGREIKLDVNNVMHYKYFDPSNEYWGQSSLSAAADALIQERNAVTYNKKFFTNSARPDVVFNVSGPLTPRGFKRMKAMIKQMFGGVDKAHSAAIIEGGVKIDQLGFAPKDLEFLNLRKFNRDEILACFGVPPAMVGVFETAIRANAKEQRKQFWEGAMVHKMRKVEMQINQDFVSKFASTSNKRIHLAFDLTGVESLGESTEAKTLRLTQLVRDGILSRNEARIEIGYETIPDEMMDTFFVSSNFLPIDSSDRLENQNQDISDPSLESMPPDQPKPIVRMIARNKQTFIDKKIKQDAINRCNVIKAQLLKECKVEMQTYANELMEQLNKKLNFFLDKRSKGIYSKSITLKSIYNEEKELAALIGISKCFIERAIFAGGTIASTELSLICKILSLEFNAEKTNVKNYVIDHCNKVVESIETHIKTSIEKQLKQINENEKEYNSIVIELDNLDMKFNSAINAGRKFAAEQCNIEFPSSELFKMWICSSDTDKCSEAFHSMMQDLSFEKPVELNKDYANGLKFPNQLSNIDKSHCECIELYVPGSIVEQKICRKYRRLARLTDGWKLLNKKMSKSFTQIRKIENHIYKTIRNGKH